MGVNDPLADDDALPAEERAAVRRRVLNVIGHELRTPVTTMGGLVEALGNASPETVRHEIAPALRRLTSRLEGLLDDLLLVADVTTVLPVQTPRRFRPLQVLEPLCDGLAVTEEDGETYAYAAPDAVSQALAHILDNARKYGHDATVRIRTADETAQIAVHSPGPTPHPEEVRLATTAFYRGEHAVTAAPGLGIGLTLARMLIEHTGGRLGFDTLPEGGTVTTVSIPSTETP